jgi:hypothetical protein
VTPEIHKADELVDFTSHLGEIDSIFLDRAQNRTFPAARKKNLFESARSGDISNHRGSFFVALNGSGRVIGYLAGCLKNPTELVHFSDIEYFQTIGDICRDYPAHLHINVAPQWRNHGLELRLLSDLPSGQGCIQSRASTW